jgi:hypothetical protein
MAFDDKTRRTLLKTVTSCRNLLTSDFDAQLRSRFGIYADEGNVLELSRLANLTDKERETARVLRERIDHLAAGKGKQGITDAVHRIRREQAFTILNRFAALRMAEERGVIRPSVANGLSSNGFRMFNNAAGSEEHAAAALGGAYDRYLVYLDCLFDELSLDLGILFDRSDAMGLLFPSESALNQLLNELNSPSVSHLWAEDETIGWIYQYYNDPEERKKMRAESAAPRNSRELAIRNQFFTPRYVVEFLTDNTLGRIWYEMTKGQTRLKDQCRYLVRRPTEIFLADGETAPEVGSGQSAVGHEENLTQQELLKQPVHIPHRPIKDPREIRLLDPACGSMHFGLYAFDLFETIYEEYWDLLVADSEDHGKPHVAQLSGPDRVAEGHGSGGSHLHDQSLVSQTGALRADQPDPQGGGVGAVEHRGGPGPQNEGGIPAGSVSGSRLDPGSGNPDHHRDAPGIHGPGSRGGSPESGCRSGSPRPGTHELPHSLTSSSAYRPLPTAYPSKEEFLRDVPRLIIEHNIHGIDIDPRATQIAALSLWLRAQKTWQQQKVPAANRPEIRRSNVVCAEPMPGSPEMLEDFIATLEPKETRSILGELLKTVFDKMQLAGEAGALLKIEEEITSAIETARQEWRKQQNDLLTLKEESKEEFFNTAEQQLINALRSYAEQADANSYQRRLFADDAARGFAFIDLCRKQYDAVVMNPPFGQVTGNYYEELRKTYSGAHHDIYAAFVRRANQMSPNGNVGAISSRSFLLAPRLDSFRTSEILPNILTIVDFGLGVMDDAYVESAAYILSSSSPNGFSVFDLRRRAPMHSSEELLHTIKHEARFCRATDFVDLPKARILYTLPSTIRSLMTEGEPFEPHTGTSREGMKSFNNDRYLRIWWEVPPSLIGKGRPWVRMAKGGGYSLYANNFPLVLNWKNNGAELLETNRQLNGSTAQVRQASDYWYRPGLTYSKRSAKGFSARVLPGDFIFTSNGPAILLENPDRTNLFALLAWINSRFIRALIQLQANFADYSSGSIKKLPWMPDLAVDHNDQLEAVGRELISITKGRIADTETSNLFNLSSHLRRSATPRSAISEDDDAALVSRLMNTADQIVEEVYSNTNVEWIEEVLRCDDEEEEDSEADNESDDVGVSVGTIVTSICLGTAFGRWDIRYATGERQPPELPDPFDPLPVCPPGMLQNAEGLPAEPKDVPADYPLRISWPGILVDDENHPEDIVARVREAIEVIWKDRAEAIEAEACEILEVKAKPKEGQEALRVYFRDPNRFFKDHLARYSKSRRKAPIYWPLSTDSGSYTLWIYYHRLSDQTLFRCIEMVERKREDVGRELETLRSRVGTGGTAQERQQMEEQAAFLIELKALRDRLHEVTRLPYHPNLNDGVQITAAPLWQCFRHGPWQKVLKETWTDLSKGKYDWAHLAMSIWPDRVEKVCEKDRSIAIAHGREDLCKVPPSKPVAKRASRKRTKDTAPDDAESDLLEDD